MNRYVNDTIEPHLRAIARTSEAAFDAITRLASQICGTPMAIITLTGETTQLIKSSVGYPFQAVRRDHTFCTHVTGQHLLEITDAQSDPRFADNPFVTREPNIRYYAGAPLNSDDRQLGVLCVLDRQPQQMDATQRAALHDLALVTTELLEQRIATRRAETRQSMLDILLDALPEGIVACDSGGQLTLFNSRAREWHGADPLKVSPESWAQHFDLFEADGTTVLDPGRIPLLRAWRGERVKDAEICIKARRQPPRSVLANGRSFQDPEGHLLGAVVAMHDITERKQHINEIIQVRRYLQAVIDASTEVAIIATERNGTITLFNPGAERLLDYAAKDVVGRLTPVTFHVDAEVAEHAVAVSREFDQPLTGFEALTARPRFGGTESRDWTLVRADGETRRVRLAVSAIRDTAGQTIGFLKVAIDRSRLLEMENELHVSQARFQAAFDTAPQGMALIARDGHLMEVNRIVCEVSGYSREELLRKRFAELSHPLDLRLEKEQLQRLVAGEIESYQLAKRMFNKSGETLWVQCSTSLVRNAMGHPLYFVSQLQDITQQQELARLKDEFVSVVSHELRTPLTSIKGALRLLTAGALGAPPAAMAPVLKIAEDNANRLGLLVDDLLDFEKIAANKLPVDIRAHSASGLVDEAIAANSTYGETFGVVIDRDAGASARVAADGLRFAQIMNNLLSNAIKFSPRDERVTVGTHVQDGGVRIAVADRGPGIPESFRARVFERFAQADHGTRRAQGGTGLGLAITRGLVELMNGRIGFEDRDGGGTVFWFWLPLANDA